MSDVIKLEYKLVITIYPNGKCYERIFPIGKAQHIRREDANKSKVEAQQRLDLAKKDAQFKNEGVETI